MKKPLEQALETALPAPAAYVLWSQRTGRRYTGSCRELVERLKDHRAGRVSRTRNGRPLHVVHIEYHDKYADALHREIYLKTGAGRDFLADLEPAD